MAVLGESSLAGGRLTYRWTRLRRRQRSRTEHIPTE